MGDTQVIMSLANGAALAIGRFGFLPYQRRKIEEAGLPLQNGETYVEAGDKLAEVRRHFSLSLSLSSSPRVGSLSSRSPSSRPFADALTSPPPPSAFPVLDIPQEAEVFSTKDPAGFTLIDTMAWGSIGHVLGYAALAAKVSPPRPRESPPPPRPVRTRALTPSPLLAERQRLGRQCLATLVNKSLVHDTDDARRM